MERIKPLLHLLAVAFAGGSLSVLSKLALEDMPVFGFTTLRFAIGVFILSLALIILKRYVSFKKFKLFTPVAALWWLASLIFAFGLQRTNATTAQFIHAAIPIATALLAGYALKQKLNHTQWTGVMVAAIGMGVVILSKGDLSVTNSNLLGNLLVLLSVGGFASYAVYSKLSTFAKLDALDMIFIGMVSGLLVSLPFALTELTTSHWITQVPHTAWIAAILSGFAITLFFAGFQTLIKKHGPSYAALNQYLVPIFVIVWAFIVLNEVPEIQVLFGAILALSGVWLVTRPTKPMNEVK